MILLVYILFILNSDCLDAVKTSDLCVKKSNCNGAFSFKCNEKYCSKDKNSCEDFKNSNSYNKALKTEHFNHKMHLLLASIKPCFTNTYKWKTSDVCLKKDICFYKEHKPFIKTSFHLITNSDICKCGNNHTILCTNKKYCGVNQNACNGLKLKNPIQNCGKKFLFLLFF